MFRRWHASHRRPSPPGRSTVLVRAQQRREPARFSLSSTYASQRAPATGQETLWTKKSILSNEPSSFPVNPVLWWSGAKGLRNRIDSMETLYSTTFTSPIGPLFLAASERGLVALEFDARSPGQQSIRPNPRNVREEQSRVAFELSEDSLRPYLRELDEYFAGRCRKFTFPLDLRGTDFQLACWRALQ